MEEKGGKRGRKPKIHDPTAAERAQQTRSSTVAQHTLACAYAKPRNKGTSEPKLGSHEKMQEVELKKRKKKN